MALQTQLIDPAQQPVFDIVGPKVRFVVEPAETSGAFGIIEGVIEPGVIVPLHSHADPEVFFVLEGRLEFLRHDGASGRWMTAGAGEVVSIPSGVKHALRNTSSSTPVKALLTTTPNIYGFFHELSRPSQSNGRPTEEEMQRLFKLAAKYGYWMASPEENEAVGISL
jgi:quercetin dioxygenase-like cupin family protein